MSIERPSLDKYIASIDEHIEKLQEHVPASDEQPKDRPKPQRELMCPLCGQALQRGLVSVHGTFWGMMVVGFSHQQCWFAADGGGAEEEIIASGHAKRGWRCTDCGFVGIEGGEQRPANKSIGDL